MVEGLGASSYDVASKVCQALDVGARRASSLGHPGRLVQVESMNTMLKAPGIKRLPLKYGEPLSNLAFKFNLRRYTLAPAPARPRRVTVRGMTPGQGLTLVHYSAQPEPLLSLKHNNYSPKKCLR